MSEDIYAMVARQGGELMAEINEIHEQLHACAQRVIAAEALLHDADAVIEILRGDQPHILSGDLLAAIEQHWQTYPEPLK